MRPSLYGLEAICPGSRTTAGAVLLALAGLAGCASPGSPKPPSLQLPEKARGLAAMRVGDQVRLSWTTPARTTDGQAIRGATTAVICQGAGSAPALPSGAGTNPGTCTAVARLPVQAGASAAQVPLPARANLGPPHLLSYRIELLNSHGHSAGFSEPAFTASGASPAPAGPLTATPTRQGVLLRWTALPPTNSAGGTMQITRTSTPAAGKPEPVLLRPDEAAGPGDPTGMMDRAARGPALAGLASSYVAQRTRAVSLGGRTIVLYGEPSAPVAVTWKPMFAPAPPVGLTAIASVRPPAIDLSWDAADDDDVAGYILYRAERGSADALVRLTPQPVSSPAYRDFAVHPGVLYRYAVTAVDRHHNESAQSRVIEETAAQP